jgi:hypothetical protein
MLELSFLGCKSGFEHGIRTENWFQRWKRRYIEGWWAGKLEPYKSYKTTKTVMDDEDEEETTKTIEAKYKGLTAHFASIELYESPLDPHKIIHLAKSVFLLTLS